MMKKKRIWIGMFFVLGIILSLSFINSYATSNVQFTQYQPSAGLFGIQSSLEFDDSMCKEGQDFLIQIAPLGCTPAVVRSDLLEEQNVPVFCQLAATKINPLIDVNAIESLSFSGDYPSEVAGVGFEPVRSALGDDGTLNSPTLLDNIGYAVIVLKQQQNESSMPDYVEGSLSVKISYDIKNAYGIGKTSFYLPVLTDDEWEERKNQYSFWNGKGFLRAEGIEGSRVKVALYDGTGKKVTSVVLNEGDTSEEIYLPGFYCLSSLELKLSDLEAPETRARILVDDDYFEVKEGESFLDDRCTVTDLFEAGILDRVTIKCKEDEGGGLFGSTSHVLSIVPKLKLSINGVEGEYAVGDFLYEYGVNHVYLGYARTKGDTGLKEDLEIGIISVPKDYVPVDNKLDEGTLNYVSRLASAYGLESRKGKADVWGALREAGQFLIGVVSNIHTYISTGKSLTFISYNKTIDVFGGEKTSLGGTVYGDKSVNIIGFSEPVDIGLDLTTSDMSEARKNYDLAEKDFKTVRTNYPLEKEIRANETYGEKALVSLIQLNKNIGQNRKAADLCEEFKESYTNSKLPIECSDISISNSDIATTLVTINGRTRQITLSGIYEPDLTECSAEVLVEGPNGKKEVITLGKGRTVFLDDFRGKPGEIINLGTGVSNAFSYVANTNVVSPNNLYVRFSNQWQYSYGSGDFSWKSASDIQSTIPKANLISSLVGRDFNTGYRIIMAEQGYFQESIELLDLNAEEAKLRISVRGVSVGTAISETLTSDSYSLELGKSRTVGKDYSFSLNKINLKENAVVVVNPGIDNTGSEANLSFKIGIEKRGIQLSPSKIRNMIINLNDSIEKWNDTSAKLGKVVKGLKSACLVGGVALTVKNFFANVGGRGIARRETMRREGGWYDICSQEIKDKKSSSLDECYNRHSSEIDRDVEFLYTKQQEQQKYIDEWQEGAIKSGGILQDNVVNTDIYMNKSTSDVQKYLQETGTGEIMYQGQKVDVSNVLTYKLYKEQGTFTPEELRDIHLNAMILNDPQASTELKSSANKSLNSLLGNVYSASKEYEAAQAAANLNNINTNQIAYLSTKGEKKETYSGLTVKDINSQVKDKLLNRGYSADNPVQVVQIGGNIYYAVLNNPGTGTYGINTDALGKKDVFDSYGDWVDISEDKSNPLNNVVFEKMDESSYKGKGFKNPTIHFYETAPYEGLPAIVPINVQDGWYAATKQTLPVFGGISAYDSSGRVSSFYLCHVGNNGMQEFNSGIGDDTCQMINLGTGMPYNQFPGLSKSDAEKYVGCGVQAIEQASKAYESGKYIRIRTSCGTVDAKIGEPAVDVPAIQCQDFMSPSDCKILYNLCDPVICPASRCDLGGTYPVKDVIQTGIVGGFILCLPNFKEGVYIPVCLTGIQAGIDGLVSVFTAHRDCLQEQLDTGKTIGICDEMYSVYMCEFFWRQALPLAEVAIPKLISVIVGENTARGGGEYLGVQNAWDTASKSFSFFTQQYAVNAFKAFKARTTEQIGTEICRSYVSGVVPSMEMLDQLTEPDSPVQFHGRFDEISFTTTTSPPISQYKVFYHIYAGKDSSAYYKVYLKGSTESSYYQDVSQSRLVAQGYIAAGDIATETKDFTAPSGYQELCINVNGQEECGFKQVTTSLAINYVKDQYIKEQAAATDIKTESECISGSASAYSLLSPNLQEGATEVVNPSVYNYGITRICSTENPGKGTDPNAGGNNSRWVDVGYCGNAQIRCWMDTSKIDDITSFESTEEDILSTLNENTLKLLEESGDYLSEDQLSAELKKANEIKDPEKKIQVITELLGKVFFNRDKAELYLERGKIYMNISKFFFDKEIKRLGAERTEELEKERAEEIGELVVESEAEWEKIKESGYYSEDEVRSIEDAEYCDDCGSRITCTKKICDGIKIRTGRNCVYNPPIPGAQKLGTCEEVIDPKIILENIKTATTCARAMDIVYTADYGIPALDKYRDIFEMAVVLTCFNMNKIEDAKNYLNQVNRANLFEEYGEVDYYYYGSMIYYIQEDYNTAMSFAEQLRLKSLGIGGYGIVAEGLIDLIPSRINLANEVSVPLDILLAKYKEFIPKVGEKILRDKLNEEYKKIGGIEIIVPEEIEEEPEEEGEGASSCGNGKLEGNEICEFVGASKEVETRIKLTTEIPGQFKLGRFELYPEEVLVDDIWDREGYVMIYGDSESNLNREFVKVIDLCAAANSDCEDSLELNLKGGNCVNSCQTYIPRIMCIDNDAWGWDDGSGWYYLTKLSYDEKNRKIIVDKTYSSFITKGNYGSHDCAPPAPEPYTGPLVA